MKLFKVYEWCIARCSGINSMTKVWNMPAVVEGEERSFSVEGRCQSRPSILLKLTRILTTLRTSITNLWYVHLFGFVTWDSPCPHGRIPFHSAITNRSVHRWRAKTTFTLACEQAPGEREPKESRPDRFALQILHFRVCLLASLANVFSGFAGGKFAGYLL